MRFSLMAAILLAGVAAPVAAQRTESVEQRVNRIEQELRAVQRRVFPGGRNQFIEPEIQPQAVAPPTQGPPASTALSNLTGRIDALESQLRSLTNQVEEQGFRTRQLEQQLTQLRTDLGARIDRLEAAAPAVTPPQTSEPEEAPRPTRRPAREPVAEPPAEEPAAEPQQPEINSAEAAYNEGYRQWSSQHYGEAQQTLEAAATRFPNTRWTSWMRNLQGRAYLDDGKPATAARIFLQNYQDNPHGERAADSLYFLGQALTRLNRRTEACRVYDELEQGYPSMRAFVRDRLPEARTQARCSAGASSR